MIIFFFSIRFCRTIDLTPSNRLYIAVREQQSRRSLVPLTNWYVYSQFGVPHRDGEKQQYRTRDSKNQKHKPNFYIFCPLYSQISFCFEKIKYFLSLKSSSVSKIWYAALIYSTISVIFQYNLAQEIGSNFRQSSHSNG